ncbi:MAG: hypothetical protein KKE20_00150 [Nanoarchaeota archaeon]|nr:hypothetical protein [Nanoarchaeota archaeon]
MHDNKMLAKEIGLGAVAEISTYFFFWYVQYLLGLDSVVSIWLSSFILLVLLNLAMWGNPFVRMCHHKGGIF